MTTPDALHIWTIYDHPTDFPSGFIARLYTVTAEGGKPTSACYTGDTLDEVRAKIPQGLYNMGRQPEDDSKIVESWL